MTVRCPQKGQDAIVFPGSVGNRGGGVVGIPGGLLGAVCKKVLREFGGLGCRVIWGCIGSTQVSLCVGGGEDVGGWELISWSLVSVQSLDWSPCLPASSQPTPAPLSLPVAPHLPQNPPAANRQCYGVLPTLSTGSGQGVWQGAIGVGRRGFCFVSGSWGVGRSS